MGDSIVIKSDAVEIIKNRLISKHFESLMTIEPKEICVQNLVDCPNELSSSRWRKGPGISVNETYTLSLDGDHSTNQVSVSEKGAYMFYDHDTKTPLAGKTFLYFAWLWSKNPENIGILRLNTLSQPNKKELYRFKLDNLTAEPQLYSALFTVPEDVHDTELSVGVSGQGNFNFLMAHTSLIEISNSLKVFENNLPKKQEKQLFQFEIDNQDLKDFDLITTSKTGGKEVLSVRSSSILPSEKYLINPPMSLSILESIFLLPYFRSDSKPTTNVSLQILRYIRETKKKARRKSKLK